MKTLKKELKEFYTIKKEEFSFVSQKMVNRTFRMYTNNFFPPTREYILQEEEKTIFSRGLINFLDFSTLELSLEDQVKFADNIQVQNEVMRIVKKRDQEFQYRCGLIKLTTGKGKTHIIIELLRYYKVPTLILVHNKKTLKEVSDKIKKFIPGLKEYVGVFGGGKKQFEHITVATKKSFSMYYKDFPSVGLILIDEAPIQFSKKFVDSINIYSKNNTGIALYGLSGTPYKDSLTQEDLEKFFGKTIEVKGQVNNGYNILPKFEIYDYYFSGLYEFETPAELRQSLTNNIERQKEQIKIVLDKIKERKCILILTDRVEESVQYFNILNHLQFCDVVLMNGTTKEKDDESHLKNAKYEKMIIVGTIQKIGVGVDIPRIDTVLLFSAIKFRATVIQAIGRGLRKFDGKEDVVVGIWNDLKILSKQRVEKLKAIESEYGIDRKEFNFVTIR